MGLKVELFGLKLPEVKPGDDLVELLLKSASEEAGGIKPADILVVTSKVVSKAYGFLIKLDEIKPSKSALKIAGKTNEDPRFIQSVLDNSDEVLFVLPVRRLAEAGYVDFTKVSKNPNLALQAIERLPYILFVRRGGQIYSDAGIDASNHPEGVLSVPPRDLDEIAAEIRGRILERTGKRVAVVISDTEFMPFLGSLDVARGCSGLQPVSRKFGELDRCGKPKFGGADHIANELACASALLMGQTDEGVPAVIVRGLKYVESEEGLSEYNVGPRAARAVLKEIVKSSIRILGLKWLLKELFLG